MSGLLTLTTGKKRFFPLDRYEDGLNSNYMPLSIDNALKPKIEKITVVRIKPIIA